MDKNNLGISQKNVLFVLFLIYMLDMLYKFERILMQQVDLQSALNLKDFHEILFFNSAKTVLGYEF